MRLNICGPLWFMTITSWIASRDLALKKNANLAFQRWENVRECITRKIELYRWPCIFKSFVIFRKFFIINHWILWKIFISYIYIIWFFLIHFLEIYKSWISFSRAILLKRSKRANQVEMSIEQKLKNFCMKYARST